MISTTVNLTEELHKQVREYCNKEAYTYNKLVVKLLIDRLKLDK